MKTATTTIALLCGLALSSTTVLAQKSAQQAVQEAAQQGWEFVPIGPPTRSLEGRAVQKQFGAAKRPSRANREILRRSIEGINFIGSNNSRPPDTNAAVGNDYIIETTNVQLRIWNRTLGNM